MVVLNPKRHKEITKKELMEFVEKLARGSMTDCPTLISTRFSEGFYKMLVDKKCT
jgi:hypothetical protein